MSGIEARVKKIVEDHLGYEVEVKPDSNFIDDLGADSLDLVELVMAFEEEFELEITDDAAERMKTVQDVIDFLASHGK
ncbi:acyl carrier protein [Pseudomonas sp. NPDC089534]|uniref:acyl carrier protein n=1 Tax=Pseudomonas sp. NPDC089534 TaxID=3364468 RepID=UPI003814EFA2